VSYAVYHIARFYEGEQETLPFVSSHPSLTPVYELFESNVTLRQKYIGLYEHRARITELTQKREYMRSRGYKVEEYRLNEIDLEIGQAVFEEQKIHKDYEMIRRLWAYEESALKL
jgi:hypothetical protein